MTAAVLLAADVLVHVIALRDGEFLGLRVPPFREVPLDEAENARRRAILGELDSGDGGPHRDAELGWASDVRPFSPGPAKRRLLIAGGSGAFAADGSLWIESALEHTLAGNSWNTASLAVPGHDLSQLVRRIERDGAVLAADELWLVLTPAEAATAATSFAPLVDRRRGVPLPKPRYESRMDGLRAIEAHETVAMFHDDPFAPVPRGLARYFAVTRILAARRLEWRRREALALTDPATRELAVALLSRCAERAMTRGMTTRLFVVAAGDEGAPACARLVAAAREIGLDALDLGAVVTPADFVTVEDPWIVHGPSAPDASRLAAAAAAWINPPSPPLGRSPDGTPR